MAKDYLILNRMSFYAYHGVRPDERLCGTRWEVDLKLRLDLSKAGESDLLEDTLNYAAVYALVAEEMKTPVNLVEHLATRIVSRVRSEFAQVEEAEIHVRKFAPPISGEIESAEVILTR